jgi:hypothetical protein
VEVPAPVPLTLEPLWFKVIELMVPGMVHVLLMSPHIGTLAETGAGGVMAGAEVGVASVTGVPAVAADRPVTAKFIPFRLAFRLLTGNDCGLNV